MARFVPSFSAVNRRGLKGVGQGAAARSASVLLPAAEALTTKFFASSFRRMWSYSANALHIEIEFRVISDARQVEQF